jgi:hypothetical protein
MEWGYMLIADTAVQELMESVRASEAEGEASSEELLLLALKKIQRLEQKNGTSGRIEDYITFLKHFGIEYEGIERLYKYIDGKSSAGQPDLGSLGNHITNMINIFIAVAFRGSMYSKVYTLQALQQKMQNQKVLLEQAHKFSNDTTMKQSLGFYLSKNKVAYLLGRKQIADYLDDSATIIAHMGCTTTDTQIRFVSSMLNTVFAVVEDNQNIL